MADLTITEPPARSQLIEQLRPRLGEVVPTFHLVAEGLLAANTRIDFVGVEPSGRVVLILVGNQGEDLELVGRALAQRVWVESRIRDWIQLAPDLGIRPGAGVRVLLLCPSFCSDTEAAVATLGAAAVDLARFRCLRNGTGLEILLEPPRPVAPPAHSPTPAPQTSVRPAFRTGLSDEDLGLTPEEQREFE